MPRKKKYIYKIHESFVDKKTKESYLENIGKLVSSAENLDSDTVTAIESFCNFDPQKTYETLLEFLDTRKEKGGNFDKVESSSTTPASPWKEASLTNKLKARLLKEKYTFASEDWIIDVLGFYEGSMEQTEKFLLENYPIDDPNMLMERVEGTLSNNNDSQRCVADYLRELDALRISSEQRRNALGEKLANGRLAFITKKNYYSQRAKEMKHLFQLYSKQALQELTSQESFVSSSVLDLHGFFVEEAIYLLESKINLMKQATTKRPLIIECITGKGNGSISGSRLRPSIEKYCKEHHLVYKLEEGAVIIYVGL